MQLGTIIAFATVTFVAVVTPGPDVILAMANGSRYGLKRACAGMIGVLLSDVLLIAAVAAGLGAVLAASEFWFSVVKYLGAGYLAWLGYRMIRFGHSEFKAQDELTPEPDQNSAMKICLQSMFVAMTNPKAYLFFSALLPQFIDAGQPQFLQFLILTVVFSVVEFCIMFGYALAGARTTRFAASVARRWLEKGCGCALLLSAVSLAWAKRAT
ncbi:MAG: LysE family translocator [Rhizobiaceae bacterium]|nr:LysE family translocator [Rhizobiaceae bacterium]